MLFTDMIREYDGYKMNAEPDYEYLDRSNRQEAATIRAVYDEWFQGYPETDKPDLSGRFCSPIDSQHKSAAFELYLFQLFKCLGYSVTVHPDTVSSRSTKPDFMLEHPDDGSRLYVEAVQSHDSSVDEQAACKRLEVVFDTINRLEVCGWFLWVEADGYPDKPPSGKRLRHQLKRWLESLDLDAVTVAAQNDRDDELPIYIWEDDGWVIKFTAIPISPEKRDKPVERVIGSSSSGARWLNTAETLRKSLLDKGSKYGELDAPLVIAVNAAVFHLDDIDIMQALFGDEQFMMNRNNLDDGLSMQRARNGLWLGPSGVRYTNVGSVLIGFDIQPWTIAVRSLRLFHNPWAQFKVSGAITQFPRNVLEDSKMKPIDGVHPQDILQLPSSYPGMQR